MSGISSSSILFFRLLGRTIEYYSSLFFFWACFWTHICSPTFRYTSTLARDIGGMPSLWELWWTHGTHVFICYMYVSSNVYLYFFSCSAISNPYVLHLFLPLKKSHLQFRSSIHTLLSPNRTFRTSLSTHHSTYRTMGHYHSARRPWKPRHGVNPYDRLWDSQLFGPGV